MDSTSTIALPAKFIILSENLLGLGATYSSLLIFNEKNNLVYSCSTDPEWANEFSSKELYKDCHLLNEAYIQMSSNNNPFTLAWDFCSPFTEEAKALDDIRKVKNITHGVGFCLQGINNTKVLLNIAGKYCDINFGFNVLRNREQVFRDLRGIMLDHHQHSILLT